MKKNRLENIKDNGFKVPDNYFNNFEQNLLNEIKLKNKINTSGFKVPEGYFESLTQTIHNAVTEKKQGKVISLFSWKKIAYATGIAASLILMFNIIYNKKEVVTLDSVETASIENYILNTDIESSDIASLLSNEDISEMTFTKSNLSSETLEDYVLDNIDVDYIISNNN